MHGFAVGKNYNPQVAAVHLGDRRPAANPAIALYLLSNGMRNNTLDPFQANRCAIWALAHVLEIACEPHPSD